MCTFLESSSPAKPFKTISFSKILFLLEARLSSLLSLVVVVKIIAWPIGEVHLTVEGFLLFKQSLSKFSFFVIRDPSYKSKENKENQWNVEFVNHSQLLLCEPSRQPPSASR